MRKLSATHLLLFLAYSRLTFAYLALTRASLGEEVKAASEG
jgi:hypothetical protein